MNSSSWRESRQPPKVRHPIWDAQNHWRPIIETERQTCCPLCGGAGAPLYEELRDSLFGAPGVWSFKTCEACGALWLDPRPNPATIGEAYQNYHTHGHAGWVARLTEALVARVARERAARIYGFGRPTWGLSQICALASRLYPGLADHADALISHLPASACGAGARILDVGCGDGKAIAFLSRLGWRATGLEIDPLAVEAARSRGLDVIEGDIVSAAFADGSFDAITSTHVLEHVHDPRAFLAECRRILKTGGRLVAMTPNARSELLSRHGRNWRGLEPPRHLQLFNADNLARLASDAGLRDVRVKKAAHLTSLMHVASTHIADQGRPLGPLAAGRLWVESKVIEARLERDLRHDRGEGSELILMARK